MATKNIVPRATGEGSIGTSSKHWLGGFFDAISLAGNDLVTLLALKKTDNVSATDKILGRVTAGAGAIEEIACTPAGAAILDDADAAAQLATLGTAAYSEGTWTPALSNFTIVGAAPPVVTVYKRIGNMVFIVCAIQAGSGGNTSVAVPSGSTISGLPFGVAITAVPCTISVNLNILGVGYLSSTSIYLPDIAAQTTTIYIISTYVAG